MDDIADDISERLDNLDLAVTQIADAVEVVAAALHASSLRVDMESVIAQLETARRLIGTGDPDESDELEGTAP